MSIYNFKPESVYNFTDMPQEEFTEARREYDYYLQSVLNRPINLDLNKERETVAQEIENENLAALDKTFENSVAANPAILNMYVNAYHGALPKTKTDPSLSLEDKASGKFVANALVNNPRLFEEWAIGNYDVEANKNSTMNKLYIEQALSNYINYKQGQVTKVDYATNFVEDITLGSIFRTKAEQKFATDVLGKEASFDTDIREEDLLRLINENAEKMESEEFKLWFDENIINNIDRMDSIYMRGSSVLTTADMDEASDLYKLDMARRLQNGSTSGDQMMFNYGDFKMVYKANEFVYDMAESAIKGSKSKKTLKLQKLVNDDAGATKTAEELATAGDNAIVAHESNYSATVGTAVTSVPVIVDRPRILANEVPHPIDVTPYEYKFYEKDYMDNYMYDNENVINMYRDDQGIWTTDTPDNTIYQGQDKFTQIPYTDDAVVFTENPAPGYTRVVYGTGSDGKQAFSSYGEAERAAYDRMIDAAEADGNVVIMAASLRNYNKPSFKAMGTGTGVNAYAKGDALYYSVLEKGNNTLEAKEYYDLFKNIRLDTKTYHRLLSKFEDNDFVSNNRSRFHYTYNSLRSLYSYLYNHNNHNMKKASKEFMKIYNKARKYFATHPDTADDYDIDFGLDRDVFEQLPEPLVEKKTGATYVSIADAIVGTSYDEILNTPHPVIKTFVIPKKYFNKLVDEKDFKNAEIIEAFNKKYGDNLWQNMEEVDSKYLSYKDVYTFVESEVKKSLYNDMRKAGVQFNEANYEEIAESYYKKSFKDIVKKRTIKELHKLGIYGSKHSFTNIALNTDKIQKNVATTTSTGLDGIITDMYTIENSKYWYTPIEINGRWYIQNTIRWNDKPIKMFKDGTIMEL